MIVRSSTADPNLDLVLDESASNFSKRADDPFECRSNLEQRIRSRLRKSYCSAKTYVGKICDTTTDEQDLTLRRYWSA